MGGNWPASGMNKPDCAQASYKIALLFYVCCFWSATLFGMLFSKYTEVSIEVAGVAWTLVHSAKETSRNTRCGLFVAVVSSCCACWPVWISVLWQLHFRLKVKYEKQRDIWCTLRNTAPALNWSRALYQSMLQSEFDFTWKVASNMRSASPCPAD